MTSKKVYVSSLIGLVLIAAIIAGFFALNTYMYNEKQAYTATDYKNAEYVIDGKRVRLVDGVSEIQLAPDTVSKTITRYFGNEVRKDLNDDGKEDVVFLLTQTAGGSGTFYYVVAALYTDAGYIGSQGLLLGDRIAPQTTESGPGKSVIVNYADRKPAESFVVQPSVAKSIRLILDIPSMQFGEVAQNFEGEADPARMSLEMKPWVWIDALYNDERRVTPKKAGVFTITFKADGTFSATTDCNRLGGKYAREQGSITFGTIVSTEMYCEGSQETVFSELIRDTSAFHFTSKGQLIFDLKFDSGNVTFR